MAKIYALLTKFTWGLYIFASILGLAKSWVKPHWVIIGAIILLILTFPALAITDLSNQVEKLKKLVGTSEESNNIKDGDKRVQIIARAGYEIFEVNQKKFAVVKNGNPDPDTFYCPHCYSQVNPTSDSCYNCKYNFKEGIVQDDVTSSEAQNNVESESNSGEVWVCSKCGASNPIGTVLCRRCGQ
ncbi:MAG: hypothetical protein J6Y30_00680 [Treponema sp.]|nr:hypothetical protein [Treponema sp.]